MPVFLTYGDTVVKIYYRRRNNYELDTAITCHFGG